MNSMTSRTKSWGSPIRFTTLWVRGFLGSVYKNALALELNGIGIAVRQQDELDVWCENFRVGAFLSGSLDPRYSHY
jgi:hypothetical protein